MKSFNSLKFVFMVSTVIGALAISELSHAEATRVEMSVARYTIDGAKLKLTANLPTEYTLEGETEEWTPDKESMVQQRQKYYTLGGVRMKFTLSDNALSSAEKAANPKFEWKIGAAGKLCDNLTYKADGSECTPLAADAVFNKDHDKLTTDYEFYWEPEKWDNTLDAPSSLTVTFIDPNIPKKEIAFKLEKRVLKPTAVTGPVPVDPLKGDDVAMLESMLWHLGLSPQKGTDYYAKSRAGSQGNRINSTRSATLGKTLNCDSSNAVVRNIYSAGWDSCSDGKVALEGMIRRFKGRQISAQDSGKFQRGAGDTVDGSVDNDMLNDLSIVWSDYKIATQSNVQSRITLQDAILPTATAIWENGSGSSVPATYTLAKHTTVLTLAGVSGTEYSRESLLKSWVTREVHSHWGNGFPKTNFRMTMGGGDELGSMGYNQILYSNRYSKIPIRVHKDSGLNYFDPLDNLKAFIFHTSANASGNNADGLGHVGAFYTEFGTTSKSSHNQSTLKAYKHCTASGVCQDTVTIGTEEDEYEQLAVAIAAYNTSPGSGTWPSILKNKTKTKCHSCEYSIDVRNVKFKLPYRTYIWEGSAEVPENPATPELEYKAAWCFAYGEEEWMAGKEFVKTKTDATGTAIKAAIGRLNCTTGEPL
jgi:hypothetical protein